MSAQRAVRAAPASDRGPSSGCAALARAFPSAFDWHSPLPLASGISDQLLASPDHGLSHRELRSSLRTWCHRPAYLRAVATGAVRVDLHGRPAGEIQSAERAHAWQQLWRFGGDPAALLRARRDPAAVRDLQRYANDLRTVGLSQAQIGEELDVSPRQAGRLIAGYQQFIEQSRALIHFCDERLLAWAQAPPGGQPGILAFVGEGSDQRLWQLLQALRSDVLLVRELGAQIPRPLPPVVAVETRDMDPAAWPRLAPLIDAAKAGRTRLFVCLRQLGDLEALGLAGEPHALLHSHPDQVTATYSSGATVLEHRGSQQARPAGSRGGKRRSGQGKP